MALSWTILFDWDNDLTFATDEATRVRALRIERGRASEFSPFKAGKAVLTLDNDDDRFDPWNTGSPLSGKVMPSRGVKILVGEDVVDLLSNDGFETAGAGGADVWASWVEQQSGGLFTDETSIVHGGSHACKIVSGGGATSDNVRQDIVSVGMCYYLLRFWDRGNGTYSPRYFVYDLTHSAYIVSATATANTSTTWTQHSVWFKAPVGCISLYIALMSSDTEAAASYFDDVELLGPYYALFFGKIEDVEPIGPRVDKEVRITVLDGLRALAEDDAVVALQTNVTTDQVITAILDATEWPAADRDLDVGNDTLAYVWVGRWLGWKSGMAWVGYMPLSVMRHQWQNALEAIDGLVRSEHGLFFMSNDGKATFQNRTAVVTGASVGSLDEDYIIDAAVSNPWDSIFNIIKATIYPVEVQASAVLWELQDLGIQLLPSVIISIWADYQDANGQPCGAEDVVAPVATTDYTANTVQGGGGSDMTASMLVTATIYGMTTRLLIKNTHATTAFYITKLQVRGEAILTFPSTVATSDTTSQTAYKRRLLSLDLPWQQNVNVATDLVASLLAFYKDPRKSVTVRLQQRFPQMLQFDLCDRIALTIPTYDITETMRLGYLALESGKTMQELKAEMRFEPCDQQTYWLLGVVGNSELGVTTRLGY